MKRTAQRKPTTKRVFPDSGQPNKPSAEHVFVEVVDSGHPKRAKKAVSDSGATQPYGQLKINGFDVSQLALEYAQVLAHAAETFGSRTNANAWLNRPNRIFNNQSPLQMLTKDPSAVEEELVRIDHGMFI